MDTNRQTMEATPIPSELLGRVPRRIRLSGNSLLGVTIGMTMLLMGVTIGFFIGRNALQQMQHREALRAADSGGIGNSEVIGTIDELNTYRSSHSVRYTFIAGDGAIHAGEAPVPSDTWPGLLVNGPLSIRYLPADPTVNHPSGWEESDFSIWGRLFGPSIFVVGGLFSLLSMRGDRRLVAEGMPVVGMVTACSGPVGRSVWFSVKYEFRTQDGTGVEGRGRYGTSLETGARLVVLYLPQNPQKNMPYASSYYRAAE
jgi:hypothetical protein